MAHARITVEKILPEDSGVPLPGDKYYDIAIRLSRALSEEELEAAQAAWPTVARDGSPVTLSFDGDLLVLDRTTVDLLRSEDLARIRTALDAASERGLDLAIIAEGEENRAAQHRTKLKDVATQLGL